MSDDDRWLRDDLQRLAGPAPDEDRGLAAMHARARAIRRRRVGIVSGVAAVAAIAVGIGTIVRDDGPGELRSADTAPATLPSPTSTAPPPASTTASTTATSTVTTTSPSSPASAVTTDPATSQPGGSAPASVPPGTLPSSVPSTPETSTSDPSSPTSPPSSAPETSETSSPATTVAPATQTFSSVGGSITVRLADGALSLLGTTPAPGFAEEIEDNSSERVRVRFRDDDRSSRIEVRVEGGQMVHDIDENGGSSGPG